MSAYINKTYQEEFFDLIEPVFVEHFKTQYGSSPSITELKQHLISTNVDKLIEHLKSLNSRASSIYSHSELSRIIQIYIRKLR